MNATSTRTAKTQRRVKCAECRYARPDKKMSEKGWTAYECCNPDSIYHKSLLNVTVNGERQSYISWAGCEYGRRSVV